MSGGLCIPAPRTEAKQVVSVNEAPAGFPFSEASLQFAQPELAARLRASKVECARLLPGTSPTSYKAIFTTLAHTALLRAFSG